MLVANKRLWFPEPSIIYTKRGQGINRARAEEMRSVCLQ